MSNLNGKMLNKGAMLLLLASILTGCANSNDLMGAMNMDGVGARKYDTGYLKQNITIGKTTKSQVGQLLGQPTQERDESDIMTSWTYIKREEGVEKYMSLAHEFLSPEAGGKLSAAQAQVGNAQGKMNRVASVTSGRTAQQGESLVIWFEKDVVTAYRVN